MSSGFKQLLWVLPFLMMSCEKPDPKKPQPPPEPPEEVFLDTLWTTPMVPGNPGQVCSSSLPFLHNDRLHYADVGCQNKLRGLDMNGNQQWVSSHSVFTKDMYQRRKAIHDGNRYYFIYNHDIYKLNLDTDVLTTLYTVPQHLSVWKLVKHGDKLFMSVKKKRFDNDWVGLLSVDVNTGVLDTAWAQTRTDDNIPFLITPRIVSENGEEIVYFAIDHFQDGHPTNVFADMYCYNLTKDKLLWKVDSFETQSSISTTPPVVNGNMVVKMGYRTIYGFNRETGDITWTYHSPDSDGHFATGFLASHGPDVLAKADNGHFISIHAASGAVNYDLDDAGYTPGWKYYIIDGVIFYISTAEARFVAIRIANGEKLMFDRAPPEIPIDEYAGISSRYAIDEKSRTGFVHDYSRIIAFKIPEF